MREEILPIVGIIITAIAFLLFKSIIITVAIAGAFAIPVFILLIVNEGAAWTFLTSSHNTPVVLSETRDGENINSEKVDDPSSGLYSTDDVDYMLTEGGVSNYNGIPIALTTEDAGITIPLKFAAYTQWLKKQYDIHDLGELEEAVLTEAVKQDAFKTDVLKLAKEEGEYDLSKKPEEVEMGDIKFDELGLSFDDVNVKKLKGFDMQVPLGSENPKPTVRLQDFRRFMKQNVNPALVKAKIEKRVAQVREELSGFNLDTSTGMSIFMIILGIAIVAWVLMGGGM